MALKPSATTVTIITLVVLGAMGWFFWRVVTFEQDINNGNYQALPQFADQQSQIAGSTSAPTTAVYQVDNPTSPSIGPKDAKLVVVEFLDFQCPYCQEAFDTVRAMQAKYGDRVKFEARYFPLTEIHPEAMQAAEAAACADAQGKFWTMHDRLFAQKGVLGRSNLDQAAQASGLDLKLYKTCMDTHARYPDVRKDIDAGTAAGVRGTPTFFFNGRRVEGVIPADVFEQLITAGIK